MRVCERPNTKLQNAVCYAIDGDQINVLNILAQKMEEPWMPFRVRKPLLHIACERGAWKCVQHLVQTRSDEINLIKDEYYPIHQAVLHDGRFLELLIQHGAITTVRTCTQQMTLLHVGTFTNGIMQYRGSKTYASNVIDFFSFFSDPGGEKVGRRHTHHNSYTVGTGLQGTDQ